MGILESPLTSQPKEGTKGLSPRRMASWLIALSGHRSRVDNVLISVAILALIKMADISDPWSL